MHNDRDMSYTLTNLPLFRTLHALILNLAGHFEA
jgi:hypothetical protein